MKFFCSDAPTKNACHSEEARRADVGIPIDIPEIWRGLPRHCARRHVQSATAALRRLLERSCGALARNDTEFWKSGALTQTER